MLNFNCYNYDGEKLGTYSIIDPMVFRDKESIIMRSDFTASNVSVLTYDTFPSDIEIYLEWKGITAVELNEILSVISLQNIHDLTYIYNEIEYYIYFIGDFEYVQEYAQPYYNFSTTMVSLGAKR